MGGLFGLSTFFFFRGFWNLENLWKIDEIYGRGKIDGASISYHAEQPSFFSVSVVLFKIKRYTWDPLSMIYLCHMITGAFCWKVFGTTSTRSRSYLKDKFFFFSNSRLGGKFFFLLFSIFFFRCSKFSAMELFICFFCTSYFFTFLGDKINNLIFRFICWKSQDSCLLDFVFYFFCKGKRWECNYKDGKIEWWDEF